MLAMEPPASSQWIDQLPAELIGGRSLIRRRDVEQLREVHKAPLRRAGGLGPGAVGGEPHGKVRHD